MTPFKRICFLLSLLFFKAFVAGAISTPLLPAHLDAYLCASGVNLKWSFTNERTEGLIVLERSLNGRDFEEISRLERAATVGNTNEFLETDFDPSPGMRYYRLKSTDSEGQQRISETVAILKRAQHSEFYESLAINQEESKWNSNLTTGEEALVLLQDPDGNVLYSKFRFVSENENVFATDLLHEIPPGIYTVSACSRQKYYSVQLHVK